jgi:Polyketide cyclase / dehydrase and lipid transport
MPPIIVSTVVQRSAADVFTYATDPTHFSEWQKGVVDGHMEEPGIPSMGTRCVTVRRIGFAERSNTSELVHIDPPRTRRPRYRRTDPSHCRRRRCATHRQSSPPHHCC